jgi:preprotein translocase subunit SecE
MSERDTKATTRTLGPIRWVQTAFLAAGALLFLLLNRLIVAGWERFAEPNSTLATLASGLLAAVIAWRLYKYDKINQLANDVVTELTKVAWPTRQEVSTSTVVVIITSIVAAGILGTFDAIWSAITDLIYRV